LRFLAALKQRRNLHGNRAGASQWSASDGSSDDAQQRPPINALVQKETMVLGSKYELLHCR
jgi:hypothetical protein